MYPRCGLGYVYAGCGAIPSQLGPTVSEIVMPLATAQISTFRKNKIKARPCKVSTDISTSGAFSVQMIPYRSDLRCAHFSASTAVSDLCQLVVHIGVLFRLVWLDTHGAGLAGFCSMFPGHLLSPKASYCGWTKSVSHHPRNPRMMIPL